MNNGCILLVSCLKFVTYCCEINFEICTRGIFTFISFFFFFDVIFIICRGIMDIKHLKEQNAKQIETFEKFTKNNQFAKFHSSHYDWYILKNVP